MPHHKSAQKRVRQSARRRVHNKFYKVKMRRALKDVREASSKDEMIEKARIAEGVLDRLATRGYIHKNFAANRKSQMARMIADQG